MGTDKGALSLCVHLWLCRPGLIPVLSDFGFQVSASSFQKSRYTVTNVDNQALNLTCAVTIRHTKSAEQEGTEETEVFSFPSLYYLRALLFSLG